MALPHIPPPLFKQGLSSRLKFFIATTLAILTMVADVHLGVMKPLRQGLSMLLYPVEQVFMFPRNSLAWFQSYGFVLLDTERAQRQIAEKEALLADTTLMVDQLRLENESLRALVALGKEVKHRTLVAKISHETRDAFSNRIVINRGSQDGVVPGHPVVNAQGLIGQVVRVSPITSEVSLVTDSTLSIPVNLPRSGIRTLTQGAGNGQQLELRYLNINAEIEPGDLLSTSGLDGIYPPGIPVATIDQVERVGNGRFMRAWATPVSSIGTRQHVLVILVNQELIPPAPRELDVPKPPTSGTVK